MNYLFNMPIFLKWVMLIGFVVVTAGCESMRTVIVEIDFDVDLQIRDATNNALIVMKQGLVEKHSPQAASPYPYIRYNSPLFEWRISASPRGIGYFFKSNLKGPICLRFDQAMLTSNFKSSLTPLGVTWTRYGAIQGEVKIEGNSIYSPLTMPSHCASPDKGTAFALVSDYSDLFPSGQLFNINQQGKSGNYTEHGAGNWLKMRVPIEYEGKREMMDVTFTVINSIARFSYH